MNMIVADARNRLKRPRVGKGGDNIVRVECGTIRSTKWIEEPSGPITDYNVKTM
jgi:hypothetical protein